MIVVINRFAALGTQAKNGAISKKPFAAALGAGAIVETSTADERY